MDVKPYSLTHYTHYYTLDASLIKSDSSQYDLTRVETLSSRCYKPWKK